jgi:orotate phosphoribosyltransferase
LEACKAVIEESCNVVACVAIFNYGFEDAGKNFASSKIPLYSLTDFGVLLKVAGDMNYINADGKKALLEWHKNPKEWKV